jgi:hypothetical protein
MTPFSSYSSSLEPARAELLDRRNDGGRGTKLEPEPCVEAHQGAAESLCRCLQCRCAHTFCPSQNVCPTRCPILPSMRKTSVYLDEDQAERLARLAREEGRPQAEILREAVATYQPKPSQDRNFALAGSGHGDGSSIADVPEEDLLEGFGE